MTSIFKNANKSSVGNSWVTIYTAPALKTSCFIELDISCVGSTGVAVSVRVRDNSASISTYLIKNAPVPLGSTITVLDNQKVVLEAADYIEVKCETTGEVVDVVSSLLEDVNN